MAVPSNTLSCDAACAFRFAASHVTLYAGNASAAITGGLAIAVPLELRGLELLHSRHGSLPWADLIQPVIPFAEHGFPAHP
jgi:gamma-glutamyltranspeptidase